MHYVDEFRDPQRVKTLLQHIRRRAVQLPFTAERPLQIMEVCGGHTHAIFRFGLDKLLPPQIEFIHGPGCPVCVLPMGRIDACCEIAAHQEVIFLHLRRCAAGTGQTRLITAGSRTRGRRAGGLFAVGCTDAGAAKSTAAGGVLCPGF